MHHLSTPTLLSQSLMCSSIDHLAGLRCWRKEANDLGNNTMRPRSSFENLQKESRCCSILASASLPTSHAPLISLRSLGSGMQFSTLQMTLHLTSEDESWRQKIKRQWVDVRLNLTGEGTQMLPIILESTELPTLSPPCQCSGQRCAR
jgi:hypothetical protein